MTWGSSSQRAYPNTKYVAFWGYFLCISISCPSIPSRFSPTPFPSHFTMPLPFPKGVNKKLSYCRQNSLSIIKKHVNAIPSANICHFYPYASLDWSDAWCSRRVSSSVCLLVRSFICYQLVNAILRKQSSSVCLSVCSFVHSSVTNLWTLYLENNLRPFVCLSARSFIRLLPTCERYT